MTDTKTAEVVAFLEEAARYFAGRSTGGEDMAHWANVANAENCRKALALLQTQQALIESLEGARVAFHDAALARDTAGFVGTPAQCIVFLNAELQTAEATITALRERVEAKDRALSRVKRVLTVPAAEYVPAIPDAWEIIDRALKDTSHTEGEGS